MAFMMKPYKELVAMTKEAVDTLLNPLRVRAAKAKAEGELVKLEEKMITLEKEINELCTKKELDFNLIGDKMDAYDLTERRLNQIKSLVDALFQED